VFSIISVIARLLNDTQGLYSQTIRNLIAHAVFAVDTSGVIRHDASRHHFAELEVSLGLVPDAQELQQGRKSKRLCGNSDNPDNQQLHSYRALPVTWIVRWQEQTLHLFIGSRYVSSRHRERAQYEQQARRETKVQAARCD
jgi:hypothetical protein